VLERLVFRDGNTVRFLPNLRGGVAVYRIQGGG